MPPEFRIPSLKIRLRTKRVASYRLEILTLFRKYRFQKELFIIKNTFLHIFLALSSTNREELLVIKQTPAFTVKITTQLTRKIQFFCPFSFFSYVE
jgi:hypothetical protein